MNHLQRAKQLLKKEKASLVVIQNGKESLYYGHGIFDLIQILSENENALKNATIADTTIGKVAASIMIKAGVKEIYAEKISKLAIPLLEEYHICFEYHFLQEYIQNKDHTDMCPMEKKFLKETDLSKIYVEYIK